MRRVSLFLLLLSGWLLSGCGSTTTAAKPRTDAALPAGAQAWSLFGEALHPPVLPPEVQRQRALLASQAEMAWQIRPESTDTRLSLARRLMDLARYREALPLLDEGVVKFPTSPYFLRFRAESHLALRHFDRVAPDVEKALALLGEGPDSLEQDTLPNASGVPTTTIRGNLYSLLGLTRYAQGDRAGAAAAFRKALDHARVHDAQATIRLWLYLALLADGKKEEAAEVLEPVAAGWKLYGDAAAHRLLLFFRDGGEAAALLAEARDGRLNADLVEAGLGLHHLARGERALGIDLLRQVVARGNWPAPAAILAEAELARLGEKPGHRTTK